MACLLATFAVNTALPLLTYEDLQRPDSALLTAVPSCRNCRILQLAK